MIELLQNKKESFNPFFKVLQELYYNFLRDRAIALALH